MARLAGLNSVIRRLWIMAESGICDLGQESKRLLYAKHSIVPRRTQNYYRNWLLCSAEPHLARFTLRREDLHGHVSGDEGA